MTNGGLYSGGDGISSLACRRNNSFWALIEGGRGKELSTRRNWPLAMQELKVVTGEEEECRRGELIGD